MFPGEYEDDEESEESDSQEEPILNPKNKELRDQLVAKKKEL